MSSVRRQLELLQRTRPAAPAQPPDPREEDGPFLRRSWEADTGHAHGPWPLTSVRGFSRSWLERLGLPELDPERVIFLDTETTGLSGGTGTYAFLIGLAWVEDGRLVVEQLLMREYKEEAALLGYLKERLEGCGGLVTYNGKSFDMQLLQTRFIMKRLKVDLESIPHLDLLHPCRRIWGSSYADCRLETLETELLGQPRSHDVPGWLIPRIYFNFLRSQNLGSLRRVLEHNRRDLLALMGLVGALRGCLEQPEQPREGLADFGLGRWLEELGLQKLGWQLMERALVNNNNLQASLQRIEQARADLKIAGASLLPSADVTASYMSGSTQAMNITDMRNKGIPDYTADAGLSYELDLFGANRAKVDASKSGLKGTQYAHDALALVIMGDVAQNYFNVLNLKERRRIAQNNLEATHDLLEVAEARFQTGARTQLDITRQEMQVSKAGAVVTALEQELALAQNALAVLVGEPPQSFNVEAKSYKGLHIPNVAVVQPSDLLERRPDIKSMEASLKAANADIGAARAAFYPSMNIGPSLLFAANPSGSAFTMAGSIFVPIFQGGRLEGKLDRVTARQKELAENYQQTVLVAFQEAENALTKVQKTLEREKALKQTAAKAHEAYDIAKNQYSLSVIEFQDVLDSQRMMLESEDQYERARYETLSACIELFKAMGGGWKEK